jgi:hypothetical protein
MASNVKSATSYLRIAAAPKPSRRSGTASGPKSSKSKVVDLGEMTVEGKILKPTVFYVLARKSFNWQASKIHSPDFVKRIISSSRKNPF